MKNRRQKNLIQRHKMGIFVMASTVLMFLGLSYAWLQITLRGNKELTLVAAGTLYLELDDSMAGGITIESAEPVLDDVGKSEEGYTFTLENKGKIESSYTIYLDDLPLTNETRMNDSFIKYQLVRDGEETVDLLSSTGENPNRILDSGTITAGRKYTYTLKMWIDSSATNEVMGTVFNGQLRIEAMQNVKQNGVEKLVAKANKKTAIYENVNDKKKKEMFIFTHEAGKQQAGWSAEELTDYRYIGTSPNNYVTFNDELWRIIGVFTVEDESGKKEKRMKIIRNETIGNHSWNNTGGNGENDWSTSVLQQVLNSGAYYNKTSGICPNGSNGSTRSCDFSSNGLTLDAKNMIGKATWYLGGYNNSDTTIKFYEYERGIGVASGRPTSWVGEVGLMYPSDYGYAASGSDCLSTRLTRYNLSCASTDWLYNSAYQWTLTPFSGSFSDVFYVGISGLVSNYSAYSTAVSGICPSVYLKSSVVISGGDGSSGNPYVLTTD